MVFLHASCDLAAGKVAELSPENIGLEEAPTPQAEFQCDGEVRYVVTSYNCPNWSTADGSGPGGGEIFEICGETRADDGRMTIHARKHDDTDFDERPYQVRVSEPGDGRCGPETHYFTVADADPNRNLFGDKLKFTFDSLWVGGQTEKAYCVTASKKPGDDGFNANSKEQESWWYSDKVVVRRYCTNN